MMESMEKLNKVAAEYKDKVRQLLELSKNDNNVNTGQQAPIEKAKQAPRPQAVRSEA